MSVCLKKVRSLKNFKLLKSDLKFWILEKQIKDIGNKKKMKKKKNLKTNLEKIS